MRELFHSLDAQPPSPREIIDGFLREHNVHLLPREREMFLTDLALMERSPDPGHNLQHVADIFIDTHTLSVAHPAEFRAMHLPNYILATTSHDIPRVHWTSANPFWTAVAHFGEPWLAGRHVRKQMEAMRFKKRQIEAVVGIDLTFSK